MKKIALLIFMGLLSSFLYGCGGSSNGVANAGTSVPKPKLHVVEDGGQKFLADERGMYLYSLQPPIVVTNIDRKVFEINYSPESADYDGFTVSCGGYSRTGAQVLTFNFGPTAGEFGIPKSPYTDCTIQAFVIDGEGTTFRTDNYVTFFSRVN